MAILTEEQRKTILELWETGELTKAEIARSTGVSRPTVYKVLREKDAKEPVNEEEYEEEIHAEEDAGTDEGEEDEDEEPEETPAAVVLGSPASAAVGLAAGIGLGVAGLYYAMMKGLVRLPGRAEG